MSNLGAEIAATIARALITRYKIQREMTRKELEKAGKAVFFAHELTSCTKKREYESIFGEVSLAQSFKPQILVGEIVEAGLAEYLSQLGLRKPERFWAREVESFIIAGSPDYVDCVDKPQIVVDVKYTSFDIEPRSHHAERVQIYLWLTGAERGVLLYISPHGIKSFDIWEPMDESDILMRIRSQKAPMYDWECKFCAYSQYCSLEKTTADVKRDVSRQ